MRRAVLAVSVLALVAGIGSARGDTPTPKAPTTIAISGAGEAQLQWGAPTEYAPPGGSLADPSGLSYSVEALAPGAAAWAEIATTTATTYKAEGLRPGLWRFRVRASILGGPPGDPSPEASITVK